MILISDCDYFVREIPFPRNVKVNGFLLLNEDGTYTIFLNSNASESQRRAAFLHELNHILCEDMNNSDIAKTESLACY